jgi:hypothetical protein
MPLLLELYINIKGVKKGVELLQFQTRPTANKGVPTTPLKKVLKCITA